MGLWCENPVTIHMEHNNQWRFASDDFSVSSVGDFEGEPSAVHFFLLVTGRSTGVVLRRSGLGSCRFFQQRRRPREAHHLVSSGFGSTMAGVVKRWLDSLKLRLLYPIIDGWKDVTLRFLGTQVLFFEGYML